MQLGHNAGDFVEGLGVLAGVAEENAQITHGDAAADRRQRADERDCRIDDVVDQTGGGVREAGEERCVQADAPQFIVDAVKIAQRGGFVPEGLHDLLPFNQLVDERRLLPAHTRLLGEVVVRLAGDEGRDEHRQRRQHHDQQGNHPVLMSMMVSVPTISTTPVNSCVKPMSRPSEKVSTSAIMRLTRSPEGCASR